MSDMRSPMRVLPYMDLIDSIFHDDLTADQITPPRAFTIYFRYKLTKCYISYFTQVFEPSVWATAEWASSVLATLQARYPFLQATYTQIPALMKLKLKLSGGSYLGKRIINPIMPLTKVGYQVWRRWIINQEDLLVSSLLHFLWRSDIVRRKRVAAKFTKALTLLELQPKPSADAEGMHADTCGICLEPFDELTSDWSTSPHKRLALPSVPNLQGGNPLCGHAFGAVCLVSWMLPLGADGELSGMNRSCPACRHSHDNDFMLNMDIVFGETSLAAQCVEAAANGTLLPRSVVSEHDIILPFDY